MRRPARRTATVLMLAVAIAALATARAHAAPSDASDTSKTASAATPRTAAPASGAPADEFPPALLATLRSMRLSGLGPAPDDPSNAYDTDPRAAALGRALFFDTALSSDGKRSCATCHRPELGFQDGRPVGEGLAKLDRRTMPLEGVAWNTWFFWDGRKDSLWSQALAPLENPKEMAMTRSGVAHVLAKRHRKDYEAVFGLLPAKLDEPQAVTRVFVNAGKAIAAYERTLAPEPARFDEYADAMLAGDLSRADAILTPAERRGFTLFAGPAKCTNCHSGPRLTNGEFAFTRVPLPTPDSGRGGGIPQLLSDDFACTSRWSDANAADCAALRFLNRNARDEMYAFKVPSLRGVASRAPYMHAGQFATLKDVLRFYRDKAGDVPEMGHGGLKDPELDDLEAFLRALDPVPTSRSAKVGAPAPVR